MRLTYTIFFSVNHYGEEEAFKSFNVFPVPENEGLF